MLHILLALLVCVPGVVFGLEADGSYTNTDGTVQVALNGKHWFGERLRFDGRYNKVEGKSDRFSYGLLSRQHYRAVVFESSGRVFDTHEALASSAGLRHRKFTVAGGFQIEYPDADERTQLGTLTARLAEVGWYKRDGDKVTRSLTAEARYTYLIDQDSEDRHDYKAEARVSGKHLYLGARYEHVREVVVQGLFAGVSW